MSIYRVSVDVHGQTTFPATAQVIIPFEPKTIAVVNQDQDGDAIDVSFDGTDIHAHMLSTGASSGLVFEQRVQSVWLRATAGSSPTTVEVIAEG